ncbi:MAG: EAL domain-containing protein [Deinococcus sp.]|uniref:putative bifunctional diguanylate cyclase/phosphodiesterase n=1 Tax=Deinococcus sp. TaxID=47478 RepID=UPI0026DC42DE|nr:EAL domain-containing protein [Deinococcus sp.]MDO4245382.1 EAL domain-containing protein [Deinococcus sp.]
MPRVPPSTSRPLKADADAEMALFRRGWRWLLVATAGVAVTASGVALLLGVGDGWDVTFDRFLYLLLLLLSLSVSANGLRRGSHTSKALVQLLVGFSIWLLFKLLLLLLVVEQPQVLLRELTESLFWLPLTIAWGLVVGAGLHRPGLLRSTVLGLLVVCLVGGSFWLWRRGWNPSVIQALTQLLLVTTTGYLGVEYFLKWLERVRYGQGERETLARLAYTDLLTSLPNRLQLQDELTRRTQTFSEEPFALLFVDVDSFKVINDTLGHEAGDLLLQNVALILQEASQREADDQAYRLSGDEFVVLLSGRTSAQVVAEAEEWQRQLQDKTRRSGFSTTLSIGISLYPDDASTSEELLRHADSAMYAVKRSGRGQVRRYQHEYDAQTERFQQLARALQPPYHEAGFSLAYQPIYDLTSELPVKAEALLRWRHPQLGHVSPTEFIPVAERSGQISDIGQWVLQEASRSAVGWAALGWPQLSLSVNVSPMQLSRPDYAQQVQATLEEVGFAPGRLELELTETAALYEDHRIQANLDQLERLGIGISIDDFGAGYSNLSRLRSLRISTLKLDRSLIRDLPNEDGEFSRLLTRTAVSLAQQRHLSTTAEGLETAAYVEAARQLGCTLGQGYALSYPLSEEQLADLLRQLKDVRTGHKGVEGRRGA